MLLALHHDQPSSEHAHEEIRDQNLIEKLKALDSRVRRKGLESLDPAKNSLIALGMEFDEKGNVTRNSYGVFNLAWQAENHPEWPGLITSELTEIRRRIRETHSVPLRFLIWAGMGGSAEDKSMYNAVGLLRKGPRCYVLDSTDPGKLKAIVDDMTRRSKRPLAEVLRSTLVVGMALGMTSYEPVVNLEKLAILYDKLGVDSRPNFVYMTLPNSLLDRFGSKRGYRKIELQLDGGNSTAGRHSSPLTRGSLYPLALCGVDMDKWLAGTQLSEAEVDTAFRLAAFLNAQASAGRNKITLLLPKQWAGAGIWTKQDFEESLGKREDFGLKIVIGERPRLADCRSPKEGSQDRCFLAVSIKGSDPADSRKTSCVRRAGYPLAVLTLTRPDLSRYMQFIHHVVFGIAWLQKMNFVTQPSVELYKAITNRVYSEAQKSGGTARTREWRAMHDSPRRSRWRQGVTLYYDRLPADIATPGRDAATVYAEILHSLVSDRRVEYGELTFFGDTRYSAPGRAARKVLDRAGDQLFRSALRMPVDIYEGPAMNHSYHEMIIGHGRCISTVLISETPAEFEPADYTADYHRAQFLATQMALAERGRYVVAVTVRDLGAASLKALGEFFAQAAKQVRAK